LDITSVAGSPTQPDGEALDDPHRVAAEAGDVDGGVVALEAFDRGRPSASCDGA
jgi:hypothetical protein